MKHLNLRSAICLPALLVLVCFASSLFVPHPAIAKVDYTNGSGMAEGDPTDGWGFTSGGSGSFFGDSKNLSGDLAHDGLAIFPDIELMMWYFQLKPELFMFNIQLLKEEKKCHVDRMSFRTGGTRQ